MRPSKIEPYQLREDHHNSWYIGKVFATYIISGRHDALLQYNYVSLDDMEINSAIFERRN